MPNTPLGMGQKLPSQRCKKCTHERQAAQWRSRNPLGLWLDTNTRFAKYSRQGIRMLGEENPDARNTWGFAGSSPNKIARTLRGNGVHIVSANVAILFTRRLLIPQWKFDILLVQEVNASEDKLQAMRTFFQKHKQLRLTWGHPRLPSIGEVRNSPCQGGGCTILSWRAIVAVSVPLPGELKNYDRFHEAYIPFPGSVQLWVCSTYGFDSSQKGAQDRTAALLQAIECRAREVPPGPKVIGMDANCTTNKCVGAQNTIGRGWCDLFELGAQLRGEAKPATYKNQVAATCIDTILANAESMPYFNDCKVLDLPIPQHFPASQITAARRE